MVEILTQKFERPEVISKGSRDDREFLSAASGRCHISVFSFGYVMDFL
jgi:hypothetical protein